MSDCKFEIYFDQYLHGELEADTDIQFQKHLVSCDTCPALLDEYYQVHNTLKNRIRPEPELAWFKLYHKDLKTRLLIRKPFGKFYLRLGKLIYSRSPWVRVAEVAVLILVGVVIGFHFFTQEKTDQFILVPNQNSFIQPISRSNLDYMNYYFEASEMILLELINGDPNESDFFLTPETAQKLLIKTFMVHEIALKLNDPRILRFLSQMELIFIEIANTSPEETREMLDSIRKSAREAGLLEEAQNLLNMIRSSGFKENLPG